VIFLSSIKFLTLVFSHLSLSQVPLAFTHTVKGSLPLFVVFLSTVFLKQTHSRNVYLSLIPIVVGVALVSYNPTHHSSALSWGITFAFVSTLNLALLNVFSKKLLSTTFSAISLLHLLTKISLLIFLPFYILMSVTHRSELISWSYMTLNLPFLLILDGILSFSQNILAFSLLSMCSPLTYSIANCSKRVAIISLSFFVFSVQNLTPQSMLGIGISLLGIFAYNMAKHHEKMQKESLPTHYDRNNSQSNAYQTKVNHYSNGRHHGLSNGFLLSPQNGSVPSQGEIHVDFDRHSIGSFYNV
jgi:solute carrier family 35 protein E1